LPIGLYVTFISLRKYEKEVQCVSDLFFFVTAKEATSLINVMFQSAKKPAWKL
jgi:hypothetical protein